jgi:protein O-GlcNAc transferase
VGSLGNILCLNKQYEEGISVLRAAVRLAPKDPQARISVAKACFGARDFEAGVDTCRQALLDGVYDPELPQLWSAALCSLGRPDEAAAVLHEATKRDPDHPMLRSQFAFVVNYLSGADPADVLNIHRQYGELLARRLPPLPGPTPRRSDRRPLRVGIVSPDLRRHPVGHFIEPVLERLDRSRFELLAYYTARRGDDMSQRLKRHFRLWRDVPELPLEQFAAAMRADRVDIALDLAGHSEGHRLAALSLRAAPVQATYLGYANTTGVPAMDARIVDSITDPPGSEALCTERLLRLDPCFLCYRPPRDAPKVAARPETGPIVFGSFNSMPKINPRTLALWGRVMASVPGSTLVIKNQTANLPPVRGAIERSMGEAGIGPDRVRTPEWAAAERDHLGAYSGIDLALDTFPYNGTTTTCEALYMGVPVVTIAGRTHAGRVGASLLSACGLSTFIARDDDHFVSLCAAAAQDRAGLGALRAAIRPQMLASPLCDEAGYAARFADLLDRLWSGADGAGGAPPNVL